MNCPGLPMFYRCGLLLPGRALLPKPEVLRAGAPLLVGPRDPKDLEGPREGLNSLSSRGIGVVEPESIGSLETGKAERMSLSIA